LREKAILVAVDLPGYGGSDGLDISGPDEVMNVMSEYVLAMRELYQSKGPVIVVGHDWGAVIAFRFASEAPSLADRFIVSNGVHVSHSSVITSRS
jgi:pimeloyl-ACP methyl ester carboxylesterase